MLSLKDLQDVRRGSGIYSLLKDGEIVYIGRSRNVYCRVLEHIIEGKKEFDDVYVASNKDEINMDIMEVLLIDHLSPKYNILTIDRTTFLRVLPMDYKDHIKEENIDEDIKEIINLLRGIKPKRIECIL